MSFQEHIIRKGKHASRPWQFNYSRTGYEEFECYFENSAMYDHGDRDQYDFNKGPGRSMCLFTNHRNSYMLGWRYDLVSELFELTSYYHIGGNRFMGPNGIMVDSFPEMHFKVAYAAPEISVATLLTQDSRWEVKAYNRRVHQYYAALQSVEIMARVKPYERFRVGLYKNFDKSRFGIHIWTESGWVRDDKLFSKARLRQRYINWYFGGNKTAPHDMLIKDKKIKEYDIQ